MPTAEVQPDSEDLLQQVADALLKSRKIVVITGAGISTNSGIPVRSTTAVETVDVRTETDPKTKPGLSIREWPLLLDPSPVRCSQQAQCPGGQRSRYPIGRQRSSQASSDKTKTIVAQLRNYASNGRAGYDAALRRRDHRSRTATLELGTEYHRRCLYHGISQRVSDRTAAARRLAYEGEVTILDSSQAS